MIAANMRDSRAFRTPTNKKIPSVIFCHSLVFECANQKICRSKSTTVVKDVPEDKQQKWLEMAKELASETWKEDGCISYDFVRSTEKQNRFVIVEEWESQSHLDAHFNTPHFQTLVPLMDGMSETVELDVSQKALTISRQNDISSAISRKHRNGRILVLYDTSSGSTAMIADLIA